MTSPQWEQLVIEGRRLAEASPPDRWVLGDLAVRAVPAGASRTEKAAALERLAEFAASINASFSLIKDCWYTSLAWPPISRLVDVSHAKHSRYRSSPHRVALLLNEHMEDGLPSGRARDKIVKIEELLRDKGVRDAILNRSDARLKKMRSMARSIEDEELYQSKLLAQAAEKHARAELAAPEIHAGQAQRFIRANVTLARMASDIIDLTTVLDQTPPQYVQRTIEGLEQLQKAAGRALQELCPERREPQPRTVIDMTLDDHPGDRAADTG